MTNRQRLIAHYILSNHEDAAFLTSTELASKCGTSEATVIRFSNSLGFARYGDMQRELQTLVKGKLLQIDRLEQSKPPQQDSSMMELARHWMLTDIQSIETTLAGLNEDDLNAAVTALCSAHKVFVVATHGEYGLACYFAHSLSWIHENVFVLDGARGMNFDQLCEITAGDAIVGISFPPYPANTVKMMRAGAKAGAFAIAITDGPSSQIAQYASCCLYAHNEQLSFADNSAPTMSLMALILALVSRKDFERSSARLNKLSDCWLNSGLYMKELE